MSLCEQYNVQQELKRLEETCNLPYTDPAQLTIDIEKYIQSQTERIQSSTEKERLAAENERVRSCRGVIDTSYVLFTNVSL